jgi:hypothetical protein
MIPLLRPPRAPRDSPERCRRADPSRSAGNADVLSRPKINVGRLTTQLLFGGGLALVAARASAGCPVVVTPKDAPQAWVEAGRDAARKLAEDSPSDNDCREVRVDVGSDRTNVTLSTRDARSATRPIRSPDQLVATVSALASTIEPPPAAAKVPPKAPTPAVPPAPVTVAPMAVHMLIQALGGAHLGFPGRYSGAQVSLSTGLAFGLAEIGWFGDFRRRFPRRAPHPRAS